MAKPLYDYVIQPGDLLTSPTCIWETNLNAITVPEIEGFTSDFEFTIKKAGVMHGMGSWFDVQ